MDLRGVQNRGASASMLGDGIARGMTSEAHQILAAPDLRQNRVRFALAVKLAGTWN